MKKLIAGIIVSSVLIYLSFRGINFQEVADGLRTFKYIYVPSVLVAMLLMHALRSFRWGLILSPIEKVDQFSLFSVSCVGFFAIVAIPARLGELVRPYLITKKTAINMSAALGTIFVERIFDSATILLIFICALIFTPLPSWLIDASITFSLVTLIILAVMIYAIVKREACLKILNRLIMTFPEKYTLRLNRLIRQFIDGFSVIKDYTLILRIAFLSIMIWLIGVAAIYILFLAFDLTLPPAAPFVLMFILIIGIAIPTAPGFVGNFHYFCILGLSLFGVAKSEALIFAVIYHFLSIGFVAVLGLAFLPFNRFSLSNLQSNEDPVLK